MNLVRAVEWIGDRNGHLKLLDQTLLPGIVQYRQCRDLESVREAIRQLAVRGAPAIGVSAGYALVLWLQGNALADEAEVFAAVEYLASSRPTAVNLRWALERMKKRWLEARQNGQRGHALDVLLEEAHAIAEEDRLMCDAIGKNGAELLQPGQGVLTHCNTGALATAGTGTALAILWEAHRQGKKIRVFADETRPLLQGARLTAWELQQAGVDVTLICDSMAAQVMKEGKVQAVIVGADRIAANGDTANKVGTYGLAVLARAHGLPFYVAAPSSTFDLAIDSGEAIPIEQRDAREIIHFGDRPTAPEGVKVYNPAFDVTPASLISGIVTERGVIQPVGKKEIAIGLASRS